MTDVSKSLRELTGVGEKLVPADARDLVRQRIEIRNKPICELTDEELHQALKIGCDAGILVPVTISRLKQDSELLALLCAALRSEFDWRAHPHLVREARRLSSTH